MVRIDRIIELLAPAIIGVAVLYFGLRIVVTDWVRFGYIVAFLGGGFLGICTMAIIASNSISERKKDEPKN